jgi:hypothetical protein
VKVWNDDNNRDGIRPISLAVTLTGSDGSVHSRRLTEANNWMVTVDELPLYIDGTPIVYTWTEENVDGYTAEKEVNGNVTTFTNTHEISRRSASVTKIWDDMENAGNTRPATLGVMLQGNGSTILGLNLTADNNWTAVANNLPVNENGKPIEYKWFEQTVGGGYYAVSSTTADGNTTFVNSNLYNLTIHYRYADGEEAAADYTARQYVGQTFAVESPEIEGFTAGQLTVVGAQEASDMTITVFYTAEGEEIVTPELTIETTETKKEDEEVIQKEVPEPRIIEPDEEHPVATGEFTTLVDVDEYATALGLGEMFFNRGGLSME